jgi:hypothetical protein
MVFSLAPSKGFAGCSLPPPHLRTAVTPFARVYLHLFVYPIRTDCLCLVDSWLFTFVYVNDGCFTTRLSITAGPAYLWLKLDGKIENIEVDLFVGH